MEDKIFGWVEAEDFEQEDLEQASEAIDIAAHEDSKTEPTLEEQIYNLTWDTND